MKIDSIIDDNKKALEFYNGYSTYVKKLCVPLERYLGIKYFGYGRVFFDSFKYIFESNNDSYIEDFFYKITESRIRGAQGLHSSGKYYVTLWPKQPKDASSVLLYHHKIWHGVTFTRVNKESAEVWTFAGEMSDENLSLSYAKNIACLEKFITYYESKVSELRNKEGDYLARLLKYNFSLPGLDECLSEDQAVAEFLSHLTADGYELKATTGFIRLTKREYECLNHLAHGATLKSIAKKLQLSPKTIEAHVSNMKLKTGIHYKADLVDWFHSVKQI